MDEKGREKGGEKGIQDEPDIQGFQNWITVSLSELGKPKEDWVKENTVSSFWNILSLRSFCAIPVEMSLE